VKTRAFVAVCAVLAAGCGDDPVGPGANSTLSFSYTGAGAASATTFSATGQIPSNIGITFGSSAWAAGASDPGSNFSTVGAAIPKGAGVYDFTAISITRKTPGTSPIDATCSDVESTNCTGVFMLLGFQPDGDQFGYSCFLSTGSVTLTEATSVRLTGTFSGSGTCFNSAGTESPFTITNGQFDVGTTGQIFGGSLARSARMSLPHRSGR